MSRHAVGASRCRWCRTVLGQADRAGPGCWCASGGRTWAFFLAPIAATAVPGPSPGMASHDLTNKKRSDLRVAALRPATPPTGAMLRPTTPAAEAPAEAELMPPPELLEQARALVARFDGITDRMPHQGGAASGASGGHAGEALREEPLEDGQQSVDAVTTCDSRAPTVDRGSIDRGLSPRTSHRRRVCPDGYPPRGHRVAPSAAGHRPWCRPPSGVQTRR